MTLGLTLVGAFIVFGTLRLDTMAALQGMTESGLRNAATMATQLGNWLVHDDSTLFGWLPGWGAVFQPIGMILFLVAAQAEIKRAPFDTPEGESEIIGYFLEYSGLKSGMFLIAEAPGPMVISDTASSSGNMEPSLRRPVNSRWLPTRRCINAGAQSESPVSS